MKNEMNLEKNAFNLKKKHKSNLYKKKLKIDDKIEIIGIKRIITQKIE